MNLGIKSSRRERARGGKNEEEMLKRPSELIKNEKS